MAFVFIHLSIVAISSAVNVFIQIASLRSFKARLGLLRSEYLGFVAGLLSLFLLEYIYRGAGHFFIPDISIYLSISYIYFHFLNLGETGRRIRLLRELYDAKDGLSLKEIIEHYSAKEIMEKRIKRLLSNGQIIYKDDRYYLGIPVMLVMAKSLIFIKIMLFGKKSEFD